MTPEHGGAVHQPAIDSPEAAERLATLDQATQARDTAYGGLGGRTGMLVDFVQIKRVLRAEAALLKETSPEDTDKHERWTRASRMDTRTHTRWAVEFLNEKAEEWSKAADRTHITQLQEEFARRERACRASANLIIREKIKRKPDGWHPNRKRPKSPPVELKAS